MKGNLGIVGTMLLTAFGFYLLATIKVPCDVVRTRIELVQLTYENTTPVTIITDEMLWGALRFPKAQITVRNTDYEAGDFSVNFIINDGDETETKTVTGKILAGETKTVTTDLPKEHVKVQVNIIPEMKEVPITWVEKSQCSLWTYYPK